MDVCFEVFFINNEAAIGKWLNMGYVESFYLPLSTQSITLEDWSMWEKCTTPNAKCLRYAPWEPL